MSKCEKCFCISNILISNKIEQEECCCRHCRGSSSFYQPCESRYYKYCNYCLSCQYNINYTKFYKYIYDSIYFENNDDIKYWENYDNIISNFY